MSVSCRRCSYCVSSFRIIVKLTDTCFPILLFSNRAGAATGVFIPNENNTWEEVRKKCKAPCKLFAPRCTRVRSKDQLLTRTFFWQLLLKLEEDQVDNTNFLSTIGVRGLGAPKWSCPASIEDTATGLITVCLHCKTNELRVITDPLNDACRNPEIEFFWRKKGELGLAGKQGVPGIQGPPGLEGVPGPTGASKLL